jgi:hypothetical protein
MLGGARPLRVQPLTMATKYSGSASASPMCHYLEDEVTLEVILEAKRRIDQPQRKELLVEVKAQ